MSFSGKMKNIGTKITSSIKKKKARSEPVAPEESERQDDFRLNQRRQLLADLGRGVRRDAREGEAVLYQYRDGLIKLIKRREPSFPIKEETVIEAFEPFTEFVPLLTALSNDLNRSYGLDRQPSADVQVGEIIGKFVKNRRMKSIYTKLAEDYDNIDLPLESLIKAGDPDRSLSSASSSDAGSTSAESNASTSPSSVTGKPKLRIFFKSDSKLIRQAREIHRLPLDVLFNLETLLQGLIRHTPPNYPDAQTLPKVMRGIEKLKKLFYSKWDKTSSVQADDWIATQKRRMLRRN